jgi:hypothetical protein
MEEQALAGHYKVTSIVYNLYRLFHVNHCNV